MSSQRKTFSTKGSLSFGTEPLFPKTTGRANHDLAVFSSSLPQVTTLSPQDYAYGNGFFAGFDILLYISSNYLMTLAAFLILRQHWRNAKQKLAFTSSGYCTVAAYDQLASACLVSRDLEIMLFIGTVSRVYWSFSPPSVWAQDPWLCKVFHIIDLMVSVVLWSCVVFAGFGRKRAVSQMPKTVGESIDRRELEEDQECESQEKNDSGPAVRSTPVACAANPQFSKIIVIRVAGGPVNIMR